MMVKKYRSEITSIINPLPGVHTMEFRSLAGRYKYHPGQFLHIASDRDYDGIGQWPESRCFSMQSNPDEDMIRITFAEKGAFTNRLAKTLKVGDEVWLKLPYGELFTQAHDKENVVFIAGGTGITPFLSLFNHASFNEYVNPRIYLGFRSESFNIYLKELASLTNGTIQINYEDTTGRINIEEIFQANGLATAYFISGPPEMINSFKIRLKGFGVASEQILTDDWE